MRSNDVFAMADDLTGALEVGAKFGLHGIAAKVTTKLDDAECDALLVVDAQTRHLSAQQAMERTELAALVARRRQAKLIYKKTDSTLRGNIAAEFRGLRNVYPNGRIVYSPAYPDLGRTVRQGRLYVHGKPVHETEFASDQLNPVTDCRIHTVIGDASVVIVDGDCNADVHAAAELILSETMLADPQPCICAGPAALAQALAMKIAPSVSNSSELPRVPRWLVVNGSMHPVSVSQIDWARGRDVFTGDWKLFAEDVEGAGVVRARMFGDRVRDALGRESFDGLIVFGGDTAFGLHSALGFTSFEAIGEVAPGVPISRSAGLFWITKAGGFGELELLVKIKDKLT